MLFKKILPNRWFVWTLVFLFVVGVSLISYLQWVNLDLYTNNTLLLVS
jgi:hypothetical protein